MLTEKEAVFQVLDENVELRKVGTLHEVWSKTLNLFPHANITSVDRYHRLYRAKRPTLDYFFKETEDLK